LAIGLGEGNRILIKCHAGCRSEQVLAVLGLKWRDLFATGRDRFAPTPYAEMAEDEEREADPELRHSVYSRLLRLSSLEDVHRQDLLRRGLTADDIDRNGYRSGCHASTYAVIDDLYAAYGLRLYQVPGFRKSPYDEPTFVAGYGMLIPVRDSQRRVVAVQVRAGGQGKYAWLPRASAVLHVPLRTDPDSPEIWVTEGPLKADVAAALGRLPVIGVPGVSNWRQALPWLRGGPRKVVVAFDADWNVKSQVAQQRRDFAGRLLAAGHEVWVACWPLEKGKGLDDLLAAGGVPDLKTPKDAFAVS
jgi:hypothetical protein